MRVWLCKCCTRYNANTRKDLRLLIMTTVMNMTSTNVTGTVAYICERSWLDGDEECQMELFVERLVEIEYIVDIISWVNLCLLFYIVLVIYAVNQYYSIPYHLYDWRTEGERKKMKKERVKAKKARRAQRNLKRLQKKTLLRQKNKKNRLRRSVVEVMEYTSIDDDEVKVMEDNGNPDIVMGDNGNTDKAIPKYAVPENLVIYDVNESHNDNNKEVFPQFKGVSEELIQDDNKAFAISYSAYVLALFIVLSGGRIPNDPSTDDEVKVLMDTFIWGFVGVV